MNRWQARRARRIAIAARSFREGRYGERSHFLWAIPTSMTTNAQWTVRHLFPRPRR